MGTKTLEALNSRTYLEEQSFATPVWTIVHIMGYLSACRVLTVLPLFLGWANLSTQVWVFPCSPLKSVCAHQPQLAWEQGSLWVYFCHFHDGIAVWDIGRILLIHKILYMSLFLIKYSLEVGMNRFAPQIIGKILKVHFQKKFREPT